MRAFGQPHQLLERACCGLLAAWVVGACSSARAPAPGYRLEGPVQAECVHPVRLLSPTEVPASYREVSRLSVTCPYLFPSACERQLLARGCALGADAVILTRSNLQRDKLPNRNKGELADEAIAVRFQLATQ